MAPRPPARSGHPYHMYECIHEQPDCIATILETQTEATIELAKNVAQASRVHLVGIGTSWHASLVGQDMLRTVGGKEATIAWNSHTFIHQLPDLSERDLVIVLSHTGRKEASKAALSIARSRGARVALITGQETEADTTQTDMVLTTSTPERSAAYTMSHSGAITVLAMVAASISENMTDPAWEAIKALPEAMHLAISTDDQSRSLSRLYSDSRWLAFVGGGLNGATAYEAALKINETAYKITTAFETEQFLHGPFVATSNDCLLTIIAPPGPFHSRSAQVCRAAKKVGATVIALAEIGDTHLSDADETIYLPNVASFLTPIVYLAPLQLLAYWIALNENTNPDTFGLDRADHKSAFELYGL